MRLLDAFTKKISERDEAEALPQVKKLTQIQINQLDGYPLNWAELEGKFLLFVNVASQCGFTPQYRQLEALYQKHKDSLMVIGVPCNQFGGQEPGSPTQIQEFCTLNYGVSFRLTQKIDVKGQNIHPLYQWLTKKSWNHKKSSSVKWNFQKYLVSPQGEWLDYFYSTTSPTSAKITQYFQTKIKN